MERSEFELERSEMLAAVDETDIEVAILDCAGVIVAVNEAWERFSCSNSGDPERTGVGVDYLQVCDAAADDAGAAEVANAIRSALRGELASAAVVEIPCHSPATKRWFDVLVAARTDQNEAVIGATVVLTLVTERAQDRRMAEEVRNVAELVLLDAFAVLHSTLVTASSIAEVYEAIAEGARVVTRADTAVVNIPDDSGETLVTVAASGIFAERLTGQRMPIGACLSGTVFGRGKSEIVADARTDKRVWPPVVALGQVGPAMCVPVGIGSFAVGVVAVHRPYTGQPFTQDDVIAVEKFTAQAAITVQAAGRLLDPDATSLTAWSAVPSATPRAVVDELRPLTELSEARMWSTIESSPDAMIMTDEQGVILMVNRQVESMFGYDRGDLLGRAVEELMPDRQRQVHSAHRTRYRVNPSIRAMGAGLDLLARRADGTEFPVEISLSPISDQDGTAVIASVRDVTDRVAAEARSQLIKATIDATHDGVFMFPADTMQFSYVNQGAIDQLGYSRDELLTMTPVHIKPEYTVPSFRETITPLVDGDVSRLTFRTIHRGKDGSDVPVEIILEYPPAAHPAAERVLVALVRDVSERLKTEQKLRASETRFRAAFDEGPVPMALSLLSADTEPTIVDGNQALVELLGYARSELAGMTYSQLMHPDDLGTDEAAITGARAGQHSGDDGVRRYRRADGATVWGKLHSAPLVAEGGQVTMVGHLVDITAEVEADRVRSQEESLTRALSELRLKMLQGASRSEGLQLICESAHQTLQASTALILTPTGAGDELVIETAVNLPDRAREALRFTKSLGVVGEVFATGEPRFTNPDDRRAAPGNRAVMADNGAGSVVIAPLQAVDEVTGVLMVVRNVDAEVQFSEDDLAAINRFASEAVIAIELAAYRDNQQKMGLFEDRERIAQDLHDKVIQRLFAAGMGLQAVIPSVAAPTAVERMTKTVGELDATIAELRSSIFAIQVPNTAETIASQLYETVAAHTDTLGHQPQVNLPDEVESIRLVIVEQLIPTITEALSNIARHANATDTVVVLALTDTKLTLEISDNGDGIADHRIDGNGLFNMTNRAKRLGGTCDITNNANGGAILTWQVPI